MKALHEEVQPVETHSNGTPSLHAVAASVEVAPGVFMAPGRAMTFAEARAHSLAENAELYRRLAR